MTLCTIYDVTDKKLYQQKIEKQANNDFLTGLYNRMRCEQDLQHFVEDTHESGGEEHFYILIWTTSNISMTDWDISMAISC